MLSLRNYSHKFHVGWTHTFWEDNLQIYKHSVVDGQCVKVALGLMPTKFSKELDFDDMKCVQFSCLTPLNLIVYYAYCMA